MKSPKKLMTLSVMAFALFLPGCSESGMRADQDQAEVPAGTQLYVRVNQNMPSDSQHWKSGDEFQGILARALQVNGQVIAPEGTIVKGELTNNLDTYGTAGDTRTGDTATGAGRTGSGDSASDTRTDRDSQSSGGTGATGDPTMSAGRTNQDRLGLDLKKIVLNGEEYDIDTQPVPVPGMMAGGYGDTGSGAGSGASGTTRDKDKSGTDSRSGGMMAQSPIAGQEFVFTLEDKVELPSTTNMTTE